MEDADLNRFDAESVAARAAELAPSLAAASTAQKNAVLENMAENLRGRGGEVLDANKKDLAEAEDAGVPENVLKRLSFGEAKLESRISSLQKIAALPDPVGQTIRGYRMDNGMWAERVRVPLGVILMIYEARPHVSINAGAFCIKSGNTAILRGGSEAGNCNGLIGRLWGDSLETAGLSGDAIQMISGSHDDVGKLLRMDKHINLVIPRGGERLIKAVADQSSIPVVKHFAGICNVYVDAGADLKTAGDIVTDSKCLMPEVCNAAETLLVSEKHPDAVRKLCERLAECGVRVKGCPGTRELVPGIEAAVEADWETEYLDMVISVKIVADVSEAIDHINKYGSHHTDAIVTPDEKAAGLFRAQVDSGVVLVNASTMFCDGESLGMGAEIGISTDKIHARGPMGLEELTSYKFVLTGSGNIMGNPEALKKL